MSTPRRLSYYGYVDRPYEAVRRLVQTRADELLQRATRAAGERTNDSIAQLRVEKLGIEVGVDIRVEVVKEPDDASEGGLPPVSHVALTWKAAERAGIFPSMSARLSMSSMTFGETRVEFEGVYEPPLGPVGRVLDSMLGHRIAEASVQRFVNEVIEEIRRELPRVG